MQVPDIGMGVSQEAEVTEPLMETTNGQGRIDVDPVIGANQEYVSMEFIWAQDLNKNPSESETQKDNSGATFRTGAPQVCNFEVTMAVSGECRDDEIHANAEEGATGVFLPVSYNGSGA
ncbi:hypothetical protein L1987_33974 [Smallanthus sonchifolius]|uniref:Uncharacterized protein n=1 Tax=Smallanthus sonchifolius TaxID=185202 RepID=A0ACB9HT93_9ASTR|nr:hypothetical protein L1987_33974 [Smallanthus sonchifolius]